MTQSSTKSTRQVRWLIRRDMDEVLTCEQSCTEPYSEEDVLCVLRRRDCIGTVIEDDRQSVVGYQMYRLGSGYYEIQRIAVHQAYQRQGYGSLLIKRLIEKLSFDGDRRSRIVVSVDEYNVPMQLFFQSLGFVCDVSTGSEYRFIFRKGATK